MTRLLLYLSLLSKIYFVVDAQVCPRQCSCEKLSIYCEGQGLKELPFEILPDATALYLSRNNFTNDVLGKLKLFKNLTVIDLSFNNITFLKDSSFPTRTQELYLDNNKIAGMEGDPFAGNENSLKRLSLRNNYISSTIRELVFFYHHKLEYLDVSNNRITSIVENTVFPSSLKELNMSNNPIERIYPENFKTTSQLVSLDLKNIRMPTMERKYFKKCRILRKLHLGGSYLSSIRSNVFANLEELTHLEISESGINYLPARVFKHCRNLRVLDLSGNQIDYVEDNLLIDDSKISTLFLSRNRGKMKLEGRTLAQFKNIRYLSLSGNNLKAFPPNLSKSLPDLTVLDLSVNNITTLKTNDTFEKLRALNASHNDLSDIADDIFNQFPALLSLDLSRNKITTLGGNWSGTSLELYSSRNSWSCDCSFKNVITNANLSFPCGSGATYQSEVQNGRSEMPECLICASPPQFRNKQYGEIASLIQNCHAEPDNFTITLIVATIVAICLFAIAVVVICILRRCRDVTKEESTPDSTTEIGIHEGDRNSDYQRMQQTNNGYESVSNTAISANIYCSVRRKDEPPGDSHYQTLSANGASESPYIDMTGKKNNSPYNKLPRPPLPPNSNQLSTTYEDTIKTRQSSYMDFCDSRSVAKHVRSHDYEKPNIRKISRSNEKASNAYEI